MSLSLQQNGGYVFVNWLNRKSGCVVRPPSLAAPLGGFRESWLWIIYGWIFRAKQEKEKRLVSSVSICNSLFPYPSRSPSRSDALERVSLLTLSFCASPCSALQEHGARGAVPGVQALLASGSGESPEGGLAEEAAQYHEELAAALVHPQDWGSVLLQGPGWNQGTGDAHKTAQIQDSVTCCCLTLFLDSFWFEAWYIFHLYEFICISISPAGPVDSMCVLWLWK